MLNEGKFNISARRKARRYGVQAIYQWQVSADDIAHIEQQFLGREGINKVDASYFKELLREVPKRRDTLDSKLETYTDDRRADQLDPVELAILRIACYELLHRKEVPHKVIINEAVELAKIFGAEDGYKFVNGVLDKLAAELRSHG